MMSLRFDGTVPSWLQKGPAEKLPLSPARALPIAVRMGLPKLMSRSTSKTHTLAQLIGRTVSVLSHAYSFPEIVIWGVQVAGSDRPFSVPSGAWSHVSEGSRWRT